MNDQRTEEMIENIEPTAECWEIVVPNDEANTEESANTDESAEDGACDKITEEDIEELRLKKLSLQEEIAMLEGEFEKKREESERRAREYLEFKELFGDVDPSELASEVISMVESGVPLCAAYALYEKRMAVRNAAAEAHNKATKQRGFGSVDGGLGEEFYTPAEVRSMTHSEVKKNYEKILRSMKNWH